MEIKLVGIIIRGERAYFPSYAQFDSGMLVQVDPVYITELEVDDMAEKIKIVASTPHIKIPDPTREEWKKRKDPLLNATQAKSWKELARTAKSYGIEWVGEEIELTFSKLDSKGRWENDSKKTRLIPSNTSFEGIARIILDDLRMLSKPTD